MKRFTRLMGAAAMVAAMTLGAGGPVQAHGTGVVKGSSVFAVCSPTSLSPGPCTPGKSVKYDFSNFGTAPTLYVWWLDGAEPTHPQKSDCTKATTGAGGRLLLGTVSLNNGKGSATYQMAPSPWSYGPNWVCATTASTPGDSGVVGDQIFTVYPV